MNVGEKLGDAAVTLVIMGLVCAGGWLLFEYERMWPAMGLWLAAAMIASQRWRIVELREQTELQNQLLAESKPRQ